MTLHSEKAFLIFNILYQLYNLIHFVQAAPFHPVKRRVGVSHTFHINGGEAYNIIVVVMKRKIIMHFGRTQFLPSDNLCCRLRWLAAVPFA
jgi:hypothetical protein